MAACKLIDRFGEIITLFLFIYLFYFYIIMKIVIFVMWECVSVVG
jgi:hypothetical protein